MYNGSKIEKLRKQKTEKLSKQSILPLSINLLDYFVDRNLVLVGGSVLLVVLSDWMQLTIVAITPILWPVHRLCFSGSFVIVSQTLAALASSLRFMKRQIRIIAWLNINHKYLELLALMMGLKPIRQKYLLFLSDRIGVKPRVGDSVWDCCWILWNSDWLVSSIRAWALGFAGLTVPRILRPDPWHEVFISLDWNLSSCRCVNIFVLGDLS